MSRWSFLAGRGRCAPVGPRGIGTSSRPAVWVAVALAWVVVAEIPGIAAEVEVVEESKMVTLDNGIVQVSCHTQTGVWSARRGDRQFVGKGQLREGDASLSSVRVAPVRCGLGPGKAVELVWADGPVRRLIVFESLPWVCIQSAFRNSQSAAVTVASETVLRAAVDLGKEGAGFCGFDPEGPYPLEQGKGKTSFCFTAAVDPSRRRGLVLGWVTHRRASGVVALKRAADNRLEMEAQSQFGRLEVPPDSLVEGETVALGWFDDALDGLEAYAGACARAHDVKLPPRVPSGYCTWYHAGASDEKKMAELARFAKALRPLGLDFLQIDDGWQIGSRDFTAYNPQGRYPAGMQATAQAISAEGFTPGIWFIPFGWDHKCAALAEHDDWFVHRADGSIYSAYWAGDCLDMTHPEARQFVREVVARLTRAWGYRYIKIDGLWSGMATKILYPSPAYRPDELGEAVLHDPRQTQIEAYRSGLELVREAAGPDVFILGCNIAQNARTLGASIGLVDGMRIGHDIGADWDAVRGCAAPASHFYFFHGKTWYNDPDCLMLREPLSLDQARAWASLIALSGQMNVVSEWLPGLPEERLAILRKTLPNHGGLGRPLDLFERNLPQVWHYRASRAGETVDLVGLFRWDDTPADVEFDPARLAAPGDAAQPVVGFDFWENRFVPPQAGPLRFAMRPGSCRVLALQRLARLERPQLVSTSRHVTQGVLDVRELDWNAERSVLSGQSSVMADDPYEIRIYAPQGGPRTATAGTPTVAPADTAAGVTITCRQDGAEVRVEIRSSVARTVEWQVPFGASGAP